MLSSSVRGTVKNELNILELAQLLRRTCITCEYFDKEKEVCKNVGQRPPARVIAFGCEQYEQEIPF